MQNQLLLPVVALVCHPDLALGLQDDLGVLTRY